jgi:hypothetical protein
VVPSGIALNHPGLFKPSFIGRVMDFIIEVEDPKELGISEDEILIQVLFDCEPFHKEICAYRGTHKGRPFEVKHHHTTISPKGGIFFGGGESTHRHTYSLKIAAQPGGALYGETIEYATGTHGSVVDGLLHDLYWHAESEHHARSVAAILNS